jgi:hypothetical protein
MATGLGLLFGLVVVIASVATAGTAYSAALADNGDTLQLLSGVAMAVALIAGSIAVIAIHLYD